MSTKIKTLIIFKIESIFEEWVKIFDSKQSVPGHYEFDIKALSRGFSKAEPKEVICIYQALDGYIQKFVQETSEWIKNHKFYFTSMKESSWI